jgi:phospholipid/cholesterol/gamma-HCH transport system substrate-binding protein
MSGSAASRSVRSSITIDPESYLAMVKFSVAPEIKLPVDSVASISTEGLLGGKYVGLEPGVSDKMLKAGGLITHTEASVSLENLIGKFMYSSGGDSKSGSAPAGGVAPVPGGANAPAPAAPAPPSHP